MSNSLIHETSPYLLQHAHNPVDWCAWNEASLAKARQEDKPIIVSIGYSTCHWCHVMERESFENEAIAQVMNDHFVCIKVDREERPDVDQVYMDALHAMGVQGGWPLNVFLTPDQKPFYGGTYFPAQGWKGLLLNIAEVFQTKRKALVDSAEKFAEALNRNPLAGYEKKHDFSSESLSLVNQNLAKGFDRQYGGMGAAPKFPMPAIWKYVVQFLGHSGQDSLGRQLQLTLDKIALGGIYDQVGGGFARYATDAEWFAPHFEKMLYDNGQLVSVYAAAYKLQQNTLYREVIEQTVDWLEREMLNSKGGFYAALDADSEGQEGKFYVWTEEELEECLGDEAALAKSYYQVQPSGNWEHNWNILHRASTDEVFAEKESLAVEDLKRRIATINKQLLVMREKRVRPGLDDKVLTAWNALMTKGLLDAYQVMGSERFLSLALQNITYIEEYLTQDGRLRHTAGKDIPAFLDDYGLVIDMLIEAYQVTFDEGYLQQARGYMDYCLNAFYDQKNGYFFYTSRDAERLIADKKEIHDNVIPASNSIMAINLIKLGIFFQHEPYTRMATDMVAGVLTLVEREPRYMANWAVALDLLVHQPFEVVIVGEKADVLRRDFVVKAKGNYLIMGTHDNSDLPLLTGRKPIGGETTLYVCRHKTCQLPVHSVADALSQMVY